MGLETGEKNFRFAKLNDWGTQSRVWHHCAFFAHTFLPWSFRWLSPCLLVRPIGFPDICSLGKDVIESTEHSERHQRGSFRPLTWHKLIITCALGFSKCFFVRGMIYCPHYIEKETEAQRLICHRLCSCSKLGFGFDSNSLMSWTSAR